MPDSAIIHVVRKLEKKFDLIVMLQPTSPLRRTKHIDNAIKKNLIYIINESKVVFIKRGVQITLKYVEGNNSLDKILIL